MNLQDSLFMTYYEKLVMHAEAAMDQHPRSTIAMDADTFDIISKGTDISKVVKESDAAVERGQTPVIMQKPRNPDTWIMVA